MGTKRWWQRWGLIDIILLVGLLACAGFWLWRSNHSSDNSALASLWPNVGTDLLGAWLSVRIISGIIEARETREEVRRGMAAKLQDLVQKLRWAIKFFPESDTDHADNADDNLQQIHARLAESRKHFSPDEQARIEAVIRKCRSVHEKEREAVSLYNEVDRLEDSDGLDLSRYTQLERVSNYYLSDQLKTASSRADLRNEVGKALQQLDGQTDTHRFLQRNRRERPDQRCYEYLRKVKALIDLREAIEQEATPIQEEIRVLSAKIERST